MNYGCGLKRGRTSIFFIMENMLFVIDAVLFLFLLVLLNILYASHENFKYLAWML